MAWALWISPESSYICPPLLIFPTVRGQSTAVPPKRPKHNVFFSSIINTLVRRSNSEDNSRKILPPAGASSAPPSQAGAGAAVAGSASPKQQCTVMGQCTGWLLAQPVHAVLIGATRDKPYDLELNTVSPRYCYTVCKGGFAKAGVAKAGRRPPWLRACP